MELGRSPGTLWLLLVPPKRAEITSKVLISGKDDEGLLGKTPFESGTNPKRQAVNSSTSFQKVRWVRFKATDEIRVNTDLYTRRVDSTGVEIAAYAELHELDSPQKSDRDDFKCGFIKVGWNGAFYNSAGKKTRVGEGFRFENKLSHLRLTNGGRALLIGGHQYSDRACKRLGVNPRITPDNRTGQDRADVYFDVDVTPVRRLIRQTSAPSAAPKPFPTLDVNLDRQVNAFDLVIVPEKTGLLHNYPNPFNPETWIPYRLSEPADVSLTIYAVDGKIVRHLDLGHQAAGYYQSKSRAAYWDGRNAVGERVASGLYFYTLTAGDFTMTRKMLILK